MQSSIVRVIIVKELREILRDRRTLFLLIGVPALLYPALFILMEQVLLFGQGNLTGEAPRIGVYQVTGGALPIAETEDLRIIPMQDVDGGMVLSGRFDAVVRFDSIGPQGERSLEAQVLYDGSRERSLRARSLVANELSSLNEAALADRLERLGLPPTFVHPVVVRDTSVATAEGMGGAALGRFLPMVLILMTVLGAFYPAIDIAAGERERGTLEPLLTTSASAGSIVVGKYLCVALIAFTAAALNLGSMLMTLNAGLFKFAGELGLEFELPLRSIVLILALLLLLALLFSAMFLGVAVQAQSFREAQAALTPVYVVSFLPAIVTMAPGIDFTVGIALIPVAGVAMFFRALMTGDPVGIEGFFAVGATYVYAAIALSFAARSFAREDVLLGVKEQAALGGVSDAPWWNRGGARVPIPSTSILFVALVALLYFYFGVLLIRWGERGILAAQWLLLALPALLFVRMGKFRPRDVFALRKPSPVGLVASVLIILGAVPIGWLLAWLQSFFLSFPEELLLGMEGLLTADSFGRVAWLMLLVAITPAICEELVFRGILLQSFLSRAPAYVAIFGSSVIFGIFHLSFETAIRLIPAMFLGALLAFVVTRTGSILTSMLMHFLNNAAAVMLISTPNLFRVFILENGRPTWPALIGGIGLLAVGLRLLPRAEATRGESVGLARQEGAGAALS